MKKDEFVSQVADRAGLSKKDATDAVDAVLETIEDALKRGSDVVFSGFGKFSVSHRSAREGRNPATGERIQIAASRVPKFTAGAALTKRIARWERRTDDASFREALLADADARSHSDRLVQAFSRADPELVEAALQGENIEAFQQALGLSDVEFVEIAKALDEARRDALVQASAVMSTR